MEAIGRTGHVAAGTLEANDGAGNGEKVESVRARKATPGMIEDLSPKRSLELVRTAFSGQRRSQNQK
jgi:hypothetical protein